MLDCRTVIFLFTITSAQNFPVMFDFIEKTVRCQTTPTITIGTSLTLNPTSTYGSSGAELQRAFNMFVRRQNDIDGGVLIGGVRHCIELVMMDDNSSQTDVDWNTRYIMNTTTGNISLFLGPYGSMLTDVAASIVQAHGKVLVSSAAASESVFVGRDRIFSTLPRAPAYLNTTFDLLASVASIGTTVAYVVEDDEFSKGACSAIPGLAVAPRFQYLKNFTVGQGGPASQMATVVAELKSINADILVGCMLKTACDNLLTEVRSKKYNPKALVLTTCVTEPDFISRQVSSNGLSAEYVIGTAPWTADMSFTSDLTGYSARTWADAYTSELGTAPLYQAASAFASCEVLVQAINNANSVDASHVVDALRNLDISTVFGNVSFNENGQNLGITKFAVVQTQTLQTSTQSATASGQPLTIFPPDASSSTIIYPRPSVDKIDCLSPLPQYYKSCTLCNVGERPVNNNGNLTCIPCEAGKAALVATERACIPCPLGTLQSQTGQSECESCPRGKYGNQTAAQSCYSCDEGFEAPEVGRTACTNCTEGRYAGVKGTSQCADCAIGQFAVFQRSTACSSCVTVDPIATTLGTGTINPSSCVCPQDSYFDGTACKSCPTLGVQCPGGHSVLDTSQDKTPVIKKGFMSLASSYVEIYICKNGEKRCPGDRHAHRTDLMCPPGFAENVAQCGRCREDYELDDNSCTSCGSSSSFFLIFAKFSLCILCQFLILLLIYIFCNHPSWPLSITVGLIVIFLQIWSKVYSFTLKWPSLIGSFSKGIAYVVSLQLPFIFARSEAACFAKDNSKLDLRTMIVESLLVPILPSAILALWALFGKLFRKPFELDLIFNTVLLIHKCAFILIAGIGLELFITEKMPGTEIFMVRRFPGMEFGSDDWWKLFPVAILSICCFTLSFLAYIFYIVLYGPQLASNSERFYVRHQFAFGPFRTKTWWWVLVRTIYTLSFFVLQTFSGDVYFQIFATVSGVILMVCGEFSVQPYRYVWCNVISLILWLPLLVVLLLSPTFVDHDILEPADTKRRKDRGGVLLFCILGGAVFFAACHMLFAAWQRFTHKGQTSAQKKPFEILQFRDVMLQLLLLRDEEFSDAIKRMDEVDLRHLFETSMDMVGNFLGMQPGWPERRTNRRIIPDAPLSFWDHDEALVSGLEAIADGSLVEELRRKARARVAMITFATDLRRFAASNRNQMHLMEADVGDSSGPPVRASMTRPSVLKALTANAEGNVSFDEFWNKVKNHTTVSKQDVRIVFDLLGAGSNGKVSMLPLLTAVSASAPYLSEDHARRLQLVQLIQSEAGRDAPSPIAQATSEAYPERRSKVQMNLNDSTESDTAKSELNTPKSAKPDSDFDEDAREGLQSAEEEGAGPMTPRAQSAPSFIAPPTAWV